MRSSKESTLALIKMSSPQGKTDWIDGHTADVFTFKDGKISEFRTFWEDKEALEYLRA